VALRETARSIDDPAYGLALLKSAGLLTAASGAILAKLLLLPPDRPSPLKGELGIMKRMVWSDPLDLAQVKTLGRAHQATVNDVLVAMLTGALRRYLLGRGDPVDEGVMRVMVPVNLRAQPADASPAEMPLGNHFALVYLALPVSVADPHERLRVVKERMLVLKHSPEPWLTFQVLNTLGLVPGTVAQAAVAMFASKASAVLTNVPGPRQPRYLAGQAVTRMLYWVPQSGQIGLGISILSYAGGVTVGMMVDEKLAPDATTLIDSFHAEFAAWTADGGLQQIPGQNETKDMLRQ